MVTVTPLDIGIYRVLTGKILSYIRINNNDICPFCSLPFAFFGSHSNGNIVENPWEQTFFSHLFPRKRYDVSFFF